MTLEYLEEKDAAWQRNCIASVKSFLDHIYKLERSAKHKERDFAAEKVQYEELATQYLKSGRNYTKDLLGWKKNTPMAPKTLKTYLSGAMEMIGTSGYEFSKDDAKKIKAAFAGGEEAPLDAPDHQQIRSFLEHCDLRTKAVALLLSSSGMRIGECLCITEKAIDYNRRMITIKAEWVKRTKAGQKGRVVFFSKEAEQALSAWMRVRSKYIATNNEMVAKFSNNKTATDDDRIFPYDTITINRAWNKALKKSGLLVKNDYGFVTFHPHAMRQFYSTQMRKSGMPDSMVEVLIGHKMYLQTYTRYSPAELQAGYEKYCGMLEIGSVTEQLESIKQIQEKAAQHNGIIEKQAAEIASLKIQMQALVDVLKNDGYTRITRTEVDVMEPIDAAKK